jgi:hypothetical protein
MNTEASTKTKGKTKVLPQTLTSQEPTSMKKEGVELGKEIVERPTNALSTNVQMIDQEIVNSDIIIPKVLLMQGLSDFVADGKAAIGDMVRSTTAEKLGDDKKPITFIPLKMTNSWTIQEKVGGKYEFRGIEPRTAANEDMEWDFVKNGTDWKRVKTINVFALLPQDIVAFKKEIEKEEMDLEKTLMPVVISFRSTSYNAGKTVATFFTKIKSNRQYKANLAPYQYELPLECERTENDKGKFVIFKVGSSKPLQADLLEEAAKWYQILNTAKNLKIDVSDEGGTTAAAPIDVSEVSQF